MAARKRNETVEQVISETSLSYTTRRMRALFAFREYIREALFNPGGSIITNGKLVNGDLVAQEESSIIGNPNHDDLIQAELEITNNCAQCAELPRFTARQIEVLMQWAESLTPEEIEAISRRPGAIRELRRYTIAKATDRMNRGSSG